MSLGFNVLDGYAYGNEKEDGFRFVRVSADGEVLSLGATAGKSFDMATMDYDNNLWIAETGSKQIIRFNVSTHEKKVFQVATAPDSSDLVFDPKSGRLFGVSNRGSLTSIDISVEPPVVTLISTKVISEPCSAFGAQSFANDGLLYAFCNDNGDVFAVDVLKRRSQRVGPAGAPASNNDGFGCFLAASGFEVCGNGIDDDADGTVDESGTENICVGIGSQPPAISEVVPPPAPQTTDDDLTLNGGPASCTQAGRAPSFALLAWLMLRFLSRVSRRRRP
jgi:hypothetical protein